MIRFEFTDNYTYTCRDCKKKYICTFTRGKTNVNNLPCLDAELEPKLPKVTDAIADYENLKRQIMIMLCGIESTKNQFMTEDILPNSLKSECFKRKHTYTEYCLFEKALRNFYEFLKDNEEYKDNDKFIDTMIKTVIILNDKGKLEIGTDSKKLVEYLRNN